MLSIIDFFLLLHILGLSINQELDYESACTHIYFSSKKDCTVAPWHENHRCCYISYNTGEERKGECIYINDSKKDLKAKLNEYSREGKSKVKIECYSNYIRDINFIMIIFSIFYFC